MKKISSTDSNYKPVPLSEPLYQIYDDIKNNEMFRANSDTGTSGSSTPLELEDSHLNFADTITKGGAGMMRMLWAELPQVQHSGTLHRISAPERKRQEVGDYLFS